MPEREICSVCTALDIQSRDELEVTLYPMAKVRKQPKKEETALCILEWQSEPEATEPHFLLCKRPETGLLGGMWELPSVDMPISCDSTHSSRMTALSKYIGQTLKLKPFSLEKREGVSSVAELPTYNHKFSHILRSYSPIHAFGSSRQLPELPSNLFKWVPKDEILAMNLPTSNKKIWQEYRSGLSGKVKSTKRQKQIRDEVDANQRSVANMFVQSATRLRESQNSIKSTTSTSTAIEVDCTTSHTIKKRRIQSSDEDD